MTLAEITRAARALSPEERELLVLELTLELNPEEQDRIDRAWADEAGRRLSAMKDGRLELIDGDEAFKRADAKLGGAHPAD
ncbi:MAG: addiction module protein [Spirochaetales bacterium]|nr:addiction module protein [Spirochaetales bacterium]